MRSQHLLLLLLTLIVSNADGRVASKRHGTLPNVVSRRLSNGGENELKKDVFISDDNHAQPTMVPTTTNAQQNEGNVVDDVVSEEESPVEVVPASQPVGNDKTNNGKMNNGSLKGRKMTGGKKTGGKINSGDPKSQGNGHNKDSIGQSVKVPTGAKKGKITKKAKSASDSVKVSYPVYY
jgi:hypothetical protein